MYINAAKKLNDGTSPDKLAQSTNIAPIDQTQMLTITTQGKSPKAALNSLIAVTDSFIEVSDSIYPAGDIKVVNRGKLSNVPSKPDKKFNITIGFLLGIIISIGLIFSLEYFDNTVKKDRGYQRNF